MQSKLLKILASDGLILRERQKFHWEGGLPGPHGTAPADEDPGVFGQS